MAAPAMTSLGVEQFQTLSEIQHILQRPDMYVGTIQRTQRESFCLTLDEKGKPRIRMCNIMHPEAQEQIFLEALGNAADNVWRSREEFTPPLDPIRIEVLLDVMRLTVKNYGATIPVAQDEQGHWIPHRVFSHLRTGSNFNDGKKRLYIGKNGLGIKLSGIFSLVFSVECADPARGLLYKETWTNNMTQSQCEIVPYNGIGYTQVSYSPDFARFGASQFDEETFQLYAARCAEVAYTCQIPVIFNGQEFDLKNVFDYAGLFFPITKSNAISYTDPEGTYEICLVDSPGEAVCASFVNGIITKQGGVHVDAAYSVIVAKTVALLGKAAEGVSITKRDMVSHVSVFLNCRLNQPGFKSQAKEYLTKPTPKIDIPDDVMKNVKRWKLMEQMVAIIEQKQKAKLKKTDGKKTRRAKSERIRDANFAGGPRAHEATGILCEGDSAEGYINVWIDQVPDRQGRDYFGSLPLHGKILNILNAEFLQMFENDDLKLIKEMFGLEEDVNYMIEALLRRLRYGTVLIVTDPDTDGKHILGLVMVFFMFKFPGLIYHHRIKFLRIPVLRVSKGGSHLAFFTTASYNEWRATVPDPDGWYHEYFKGLGSSEEKHVIEDFQRPKVVTFHADEKAMERTLMAFHKTKADERKIWLSDWFNREVLNVEHYEMMPISIFLDHEMIEYSLESIERSIPDAIDGFKESQRKVFFAVLKRLGGKKKTEKVNVSQVANHAADITAYKHGPKSLSETIIGMAYDFVGSNNMSYLVPRGMLGTRHKGGKDAAADRYPSISIPWWFEYMYRKEDAGLLKHVVEEGKKREVECYYPILPTHTINGQKGVGTGWSTSIPNHNPLDIAFWFQQRLLQELLPYNPLDPNSVKYELPILRPWYKGFRGQIVLRQSGFYTEGHFYTLNGDIIIDELPIGTWNVDYIKFLRKMEDEGMIEDYKDQCSKEGPRFLIKGYKDGQPTLRKLNLISQHSYKNMTVLYKNPRGYYPKIYSALNDLLEDFFRIRLGKYEERKAYQLAKIQEKITELIERLRFINAVNEGQIVVHRRSKKLVLEDMTRIGFNHSLYDSVKTSEYSDESVAAIPVEIAEHRAKYEVLNATRPGEIWYNEISEFIQAYCKQEKTVPSTLDSCNPAVLLNIIIK
jgi:DNA topoisomerase-2